MSEEEFLLKWNNHQTNFVDVFNELLRDESFVDVTLVCEGEAVPGHKVVLAACSPLLHRILRDNPCKHPLVILGDVPARDMRAMMKFIYQGEVSVSQQELASFLKTADNLQIKGLAEDRDERKRKDKEGDKTDNKSNKRQRTEPPRTCENSSPLTARPHNNKPTNDSHHPSSHHKSRTIKDSSPPLLHSPSKGVSGGPHTPASKHNSKNSSKVPRDIPPRVSPPPRENHRVNNNTPDAKEEMTVKMEPLDYPGEMVWSEGHGALPPEILEDPQSLVPLAMIPGALETIAGHLPVAESGDDSRGDMSTASDDLSPGTLMQEDIVTTPANVDAPIGNVAATSENVASVPDESSGNVEDTVENVQPPSVGHSGNVLQDRIPLPGPFAQVIPAPLPPKQEELRPQIPLLPPGFMSSPSKGQGSVTMSPVMLDRRGEMPGPPIPVSSLPLPPPPPPYLPPVTSTANMVLNNNMIFANNNLLNNNNSPSNNSIHKCRQCPFVTSNPYTFTRHLRIHLGTKEFRCRVCAFASSRKDSLIRHFRMKHLTGEMSVYHDLDSRDIEELALIRGGDALRLLPGQFGNV